MSHPIEPPVAAEKVRISVIERFVPALSLALASVSGSVGAYMIIRFFESMRQAETAGYFTFYTGMSRIELMMGGSLTAAALLSVVGLGVCAARMFTTNKTASPVGIRLFSLGFLCLISPALVCCALYLATHAVNNHLSGGVSSVAKSIKLLTYGSFLSTGLTLLLVPIFSFIPFKSRPGRKYSPTAVMIILGFAIACLAAMFFWNAYEAGSRANTVG